MSKEALEALKGSPDKVKETLVRLQLLLSCARGDIHITQDEPNEELLQQRMTILFKTSNNETSLLPLTKTCLHHVFFLLS